MIYLYYFTLVVFLVLCVVLCGVILMQEGKSGGLGSSFGGDSGDSLFGTATADVLKRFTAWLVVLFLAACVLLSGWTAAVGPQVKTSLQSVIEQEG